MIERQRFGLKRFVLVVTEAVVELPAVANFFTRRRAGRVEFEFLA